jgi:hypothetical protein
MRRSTAGDLAKQAELWLGEGRGVNNGILEILQRAASEERNTHTYQNQTGHAEQGTAAHVVSESTDEFKATLEMGEEYSSYLVKRGYSNFDKIAKKATREVNALLARVNKRLGLK